MLPDLNAAILLYLKASAEIAVYTSTRIFLQWPKDLTAPPYKNLVLIHGGRGGAGEIGLSLQSERVDIRCYGADARVAHELWRTLDDYLLPKSERRATSFIAANTRVLTIVREGGPLRLVDPDVANWPCTLATYIFTYSGVPV